MSAAYAACSATVLTRKRFIDTANVRSILRKSPRSDDDVKVEAMPDAYSLLHFLTPSLLHLFTSLFAHNFHLPAHNLQVNGKQL
jgi:hypothetical protein